MNSIKVHNKYTQKIALNLLANINLDKAWKFSLVEWTDSRSLAQNNLLWKWNTIMGHEIGVTSKDAHEYIMREVMTPKVKEIRGKNIKVYSTSALSVKEMSTYLNDYLRWAGSYMGVILPIPEELQLRS